MKKLLTSVVSTGRKRGCWVATLVLLLSCQNQDFSAYKEVLNELRKTNYTANPRFREGYIMVNVNNKAPMYSKDSIAYRNTLRAFYSCDVGLVPYLTTFENDHDVFHGWIPPKGPSWSSQLDAHVPLSDSKAALVLIDNFLRDENRDTLVTPPYLDQLQFEEIRNLNTSSLQKARAEYKDYLQRRGYVSP